MDLKKKITLEHLPVPKQISPQITYNNGKQENKNKF